MESIQPGLTNQDPYYVRNSHIYNKPFNLSIPNKRWDGRCWNWCSSWSPKEISLHLDSWPGRMTSHLGKSKWRGFGAGRRWQELNLRWRFVQCQKTPADSRSDQDDGGLCTFSCRIKQLRSGAGMQQKGGGPALHGCLWPLRTKNLWQRCWYYYRNLIFKF